MSTDAESHDDVAGLFKRLGRRADNRQYHEFSPPAIAPAAATPAATDAPVQPVQPPVQEPLAQPEPERGPVVPPPLTAAPRQVETAVPPPAAAQPAGPAPQGSLAALFERLASAPLPASAQSPLAHLRER